MNTEEDVLKTLLRIEKVISNLGASTGLRRAKIPGSNEPKNKNEPLKAVIVNFNGLSNASEKVSKSFYGLSKTVHFTRESFIELNQTLRAERPEPIIHKKPESIFKKWFKPKEVKEKTPPKKEVHTLVTHELAKSVTPKEKEVPIKEKEVVCCSEEKAPPCITINTPEKKEPIIPGINELTKTINTQNKSSNNIKPPINSKITSSFDEISKSGAVLSSIFFTLISKIEPITKDFFELHARGIDASSSLGGLYIDAIKAGMSLSEYTKTLEEAGPAVSRAVNFKAFNDEITNTNDKLAKLGIFGDEATHLSAQLATTTTILGVPQAQLSAATNPLIKTFEKLRTTSLMTASGFQELLTSLQDNSDVQGLLLGTSKNERTSKLADIATTQALGYQMGLTKTASRELGDALIAQRKLSISQRFEAAGGIRQGAAIMGMDQGSAEQLAQLVFKKNRTADEQALFVKLGGQFEKGQEALMNSNDANSQYNGEQIQGTTDAIHSQLEAIKKATLTGESKDLTQEKANADFGKGAGTLVEGTGKLLAYAEGLSKNPIGTAIFSAFGSAAFGFGLGKALKGIFSSLIPGMSATPGTGILSSVKNIISGAYDLVKTGVSKIFSIFNTSIFSDSFKGIKTVIQNAGGLFKYLGEVLFSTVNGIKTFGSSIIEIGSGLFKSIGTFIKGFGGIGNLMKGTTKLLKGIPIIGNIVSMFIDGIGEAFTGNISAAFNNDGGTWIDRIGDVVFGTINGLFGGIFGLVDKAINFFGFDGLHLENAWDKFALVMKAGFFNVLSVLASSFTFGKNNKLSDYFQEAADNSFKVLDELSNDQSATISSIGEKNRKKLDEQKAAAKNVQDTLSTTSGNLNAVAGIITTTKNLAADAISTAQNLTSVQTPVITPAQIELPKIITPDTINKEITTETNTNSQKQTIDKPNIQIPDFNTQLNTMIILLQQLLEIEKVQAGFAETLARASSRTIFGDNTQYTNQVIRS